MFFKKNKLYKIHKNIILCIVILLITNCSSIQLDYKYHNLTLSENITIDDLQDMKYEVGKLLIRHTTKYDDEKGQSDKAYKPFDKQDKITIVGALKENMKQKFYKDIIQTDTDVMKINFLTDVKRYKKMRTCTRCVSCGKKCTDCWEEPCMKDHYDVITHIIGTDKQKKDNMLFKYKIKYSRNSEYGRYKKRVNDFDEILEFQIKQFVDDLIASDE